jgi:glycosyltransferase involved in cell wall biosynthesis
MAHLSVAETPRRQRRFRVAHVITRLELGGAQQNTLYCAEHHDRGRFEVALLAGQGGRLDPQALAIPAARVALLPWLAHRIAPLGDPLALLRLRSWLRRHDIDLVHTHSSKAGILGRFAARGAGVPAIVHTVHGWSFNDTQPPASRRAFILLERLAARLTDRLIVVSASDRERGLRHRIGRPDQYRLIRSGIDIEHYGRPAVERAEMRRRLGLGPDQLLVGTISCLKPQKAPGDFVAAAAAAHARDERLRFVVVGDGHLASDVRRRIAEAGLEGMVQLLGWRDDVVELLHAMDVFLLTSLHEGLPRAVLQAMAAGVPVVATAVDGTPEVVRDGVTGLLIPPGRPEVAAERLLELVSDETLRHRLVRLARQALGREFEIEQMVTALDELYLNLLERGPRP